MTPRITCDDVGCKDGAIRGPVRACCAKIARLVGQFLATIFISILLTDSAEAAPRPATADVGAVTQAVERYFASLPDYQPGDFITRSQIQRVFDKLNNAGVKVPDAKKIVEQSLADDSFIARQLTSPAGRPFMRKLAKNPGTFAHLDRLGKIPDGEKLIRNLVSDKGGDTLIEYLATTKGGHNLGAMMSAVPGGDLNKPTGRIYTVADFVAALKIALAKPSP